MEMLPCDGRRRRRKHERHGNSQMQQMNSDLHRCSILFVLLGFNSLSHGGILIYINPRDLPRRRTIRIIATGTIAHCSRGVRPMPATSGIAALYAQPPST